jgi:hypothetical protein
LVKARRQKRGGRPKEPSLHVGYQWGDPLDGDGRLLVEQVGMELKIRATALPSYQSENHPCDLMRQYSESRKNRSIGKQRTGKDSPHIRFANADGDDELIAFVRDFGPVVCTATSLVPPPPEKRPIKGAIIAPRGPLLEARQDLQELRNEQKIYKAALSLVWELAKKDRNYNVEHARQLIAEISRGVQDWSHQWQREKEARGKDPLWTVRKRSIQRIARISKAERDPTLPPQVDARIVLCGVLNTFPSLVFPNPAEMHSYIRFGIRPLLYSILRREFLQSRELGVCANTHCREFFEIERKGQRFCDEGCSRNQRQRDYWKMRGRSLREKRLKSRTQSNRR